MADLTLPHRVISNLESTQENFEALVSQVQVSEKIFVADYGAVGDDITDDTVALQKAFDAAMALDTDVEVILEANKTYLVNAAPRTDRGGNSILSIAVQGGTLLDRVSKRFSLIAGSEGTPGFRSRNAATIKTTRTGDAYSATYGPPSVIGGATAENAGITFPFAGGITMEGINIQIAADDPEIAGIDAISWSGLTLQSVTVMANVNIANSPTHPHAFGIRMVPYWGGQDQQLKQVYSMQMYVGFVLIAPDHVQIKSCIAHNCKLGLGFQNDFTGVAPSYRGQHGVGGDYFGSVYCPYVISGWDAVSGAISLTPNPPYDRAFIDDLNVTIEQGPNFPIIAVINDANNLIHADRLCIHYWAGNVVFTPLASLFNGGQHVRITQPLKEIPSTTAASSLALKPTVDCYRITGTTDIDYIKLGWEGKQIKLIFAGAASLNHNTATPPSGYGSILLAGSKPFVPNILVGGDPITLVCDGTSWHEFGRGKGSTFTSPYLSPASYALGLGVVGDTQVRYGLFANGSQQWGSGSAAADTSLFRNGVSQLKTNDKFLAGSGLGVGNSAAATVLGSVVKKMEIFDASGVSLGFIPIYDTIT